jgi:hypothetical protein
MTKKLWITHHEAKEVLHCSVNTISGKKQKIKHKD